MSVEWSINFLRHVTLTNYLFSLDSLSRSVTDKLHWDSLAHTNVPLSRSLVAPSLQFIPADFLLPCRCTLPLEMNWYPQSMSLKRDPENCEVGDVNSQLHFKATVLTGPLEGPLQWNCKNWCEVEVHSYPLVQVV